MLNYKVVFVIYAINIVTYEALKCRTSNFSEGDLVDMKNCQFLKQMQNEDTVQFLNEAKYSFSGTKTLVCCPKIDQHPFKKYKQPVHSVSKRLAKNSNECGIQYSDNRIYDGTLTNLHEFPWMALLIYETAQGPGLACGGVLINHRYVLTAAHCVTGPSIHRIGKLIAVRLGENNIETLNDCEIDDIEEECALPHVDIYVESAVHHPNYIAEIAGRYNDIALIKLRDSVNYTKDVQPICLPSLSETPEWGNHGLELHICGWGKTETTDGGSSIKLKAKVPVVNRNDCGTPYRKSGISIKTTQLCAGGGKSDSCKGDSGGPLMYEDKTDPNESRWFAVGVTSFGAQPCATIGVPAVYTMITPYLEWIHNTIKL